MLDETYLSELIRDLFEEYLPSVKKSQIRNFSQALLEELRGSGFISETEMESLPKNAILYEE